MKILVLGAEGQLGKELCNSLKENYYNFIGASSRECDITKLDLVMEYVYNIRPDVVINCAAYTQVDLCEEEINLAYSVNADGAKNVAIATNKVDGKLIHFSTDYVFDGRANKPYFESDVTNPLSVYGKSKLAGEKNIINQMKKYFIVRTSWLYGNFGKNFVKTMLKLSDERKEVSVVNDQIGSPTNIKDLIYVILMMIPSERYGIYHCSNEGECNWSEFARLIYSLSNKEIVIHEVSSKEFTTKAVRPHYSVMENQKLLYEFNYRMPNWVDSLKDFLNDGNI